MTPGCIFDLILSEVTDVTGVGICRHCRYCGAVQKGLVLSNLPRTGFRLKPCSLLYATYLEAYIRYSPKSFQLELHHSALNITPLPLSTALIPVIQTTSLNNRQIPWDTRFSGLWDSVSRSGFLHLYLLIFFSSLLISGHFHLFSLSPLLFPP